MEKIGGHTVHASLSIVTICGFAPAKDGRGVVDPPGSANYLCDAYGMAPDVDATPGILWTDYDGPDWRFRALVHTEDVRDLRETAEDGGYEIVEVTEVDEPCQFGDADGLVEIMRTAYGWIIVPR